MSKFENEIITVLDLLHEKFLVEVKSSGSKKPIDVSETKQEITKLKTQEERYTKAYAAGVIDIDQLKVYSLPIKNKISLLENQISKAKQEIQPLVGDIIPGNEEITSFVDKVKSSLNDLSFQSKQEIVRNLVEKVVGNHKKLTVYGYIRVTNINIFTNNRNCRAAERGEIHSF